MTEVYLRDLAADKQTEAFLGEGIEELKARAEAQDTEIVVGYYVRKPFLLGEEGEEELIRR